METKALRVFICFFSSQTLFNGSLCEIEKAKSQLILWSSVPTVLLVPVSVLYQYRVFRIWIQSDQWIRFRNLDPGGQKCTKIKKSLEHFFQL
jgi:hypothetical protein